MNGELALRFSSDLQLVPLSTLVNGTNMHMTKQPGICQVTVSELDTFFKTTVPFQCITHRENLVKVSLQMILEPLARLLAQGGLENAT